MLCKTQSYPLFCTLLWLQLFPVYTFYLQQMKFISYPYPACFETICVFKTEKDFVVSQSGSKKTQSATALEISFDKSLYAGDKTILADSRGNLPRNLQLIFTVFKQIGLICHVGRNDSKSRTEAVYFLAPLSSQL